MKNWKCRYGAQDSDQGRNFESQVFKEMFHLLHINKMWSTAYHAEGNGQMGVNYEIPSEVVNVPGKSEYRLYLADMVPVGELEHCGERDQEVDIPDMEGGGLADVQNGETNR